MTQTYRYAVQYRYKDKTFTDTPYPYYPTAHQAVAHLMLISQYDKIVAVFKVTIKQTT